MKLSEAAVNLDAIDNGVWVESSEYDGVEYLVRGTEYPPYQKGMRKRMSSEASKLANRRGRHTEINLDAIEKNKRDLAIEHCMLDWKGIDDDEGNPVEYNKELGQKIMSERAYARMARDILDAIDYADEEASKVKEDVVGN